MAKYNIAVIRGDGVGVDVIEEGLRVMRAVAPRHGIEFVFQEFPWGTAYYLEHGRMMPPDALDLLGPFDAIYFGAVGHPDVPDHITLHGLLLPIRRGFDQYVCERPNVLYPGVTTPLRGKNPGEIDLVVVRENTEGEYADVGGFQYQYTEQEVAIQSAVFTRHGCERVIRYAFELARRRGKKRRVTSVTKSNAQRYGMVLWDRAFADVSREYPDISTESLLVDAACMNFIRRPESFDVVVASNLFGDILTDIGAIVTGSMGLAPSGNVNPEGRYPSCFEPVHGSAPDIAGKGIANPLAAILSAGMMLRHLGAEDAASAVQRAVERVLAEGKVLTPDLGGAATTLQVGEAVARLVTSV
ncbi:MAG: tartrate dehydrogenase [Chloroflexi bacterium]|nr:tartrate dehydrogenase [Chloroflexota bacterium]